MLLSSLRRCRLHVAGRSENPVTNDVQQNRMLSDYLAVVSAQIEKYLGRNIKLNTYTEYDDVIYNKDIYYVKAPPITSITSVKFDPTGLWDGGETDLTDFYIGKDERSINLQSSLAWVATKGLQFIYVGGLAASAVRTTMILSEPAGAGIPPVAGQYVQGSLSEAVGIVVSWTEATNTIVLENYYGVFEVSEVLTFYSDELETAASITATISSISAESLLNKYPEIVKACEMQIRYDREHTTDFENIDTTNDGTRRRSDQARGKPLQKEVMDLLQPYRIKLLG